MAHHLTNAEVENKVAFLVQLNALLTQISSVVSNNALGNAQKTKLSEVKTATESWLKDVGKVGAPRPSITPHTPAPQTSAAENASATPPAMTPTLPAESPTPAAAAAEAQTGTEEETKRDGEAEQETTAAQSSPPPPPAEPAKSASPPASPAKESAPTTTTTTTPAPAPAPAAAPGTSSSFTADVACTHSVTDGRNLVDLVGYLRLLFDNDVPERPKLQAFGKSLVRLLMVRCCSTIMASLQHVVHQTYASASSPAAEPTSSSPTPSGPGSPVESKKSSPAPTKEATFPTTASSAAAPPQPVDAERTALFVELAREINVATKALLGCVQLITANAVPSDAASARFPLQLCIDVVKQTRRSLLYFQSRVEKEELYVLRNHILATDSAADLAEAAASLEDVDAAQEALQREPAEDLASHVLGRRGALAALWGPSLTHSVRHIGDVIDPAVRFLVSVAGVRAEGAPALLVGLKKDAAHDLFSLCGVATPAMTPLSSAGGAARPTAALTRPASNGELASFTTTTAAAAAAAVASPVSVASLSSPAWRAAAGEVLASIGSSYTADYLAAVARCGGDSNEGQLLATRLLADMLEHVAAHEVPLLRCIMRDTRWSRPLYDGILNCVVSIQPGVLAAGLDALRLLSTTCPTELGQEVGFLYGNVVLRLLESSNSPHYVKRTIVLHFLTTLLSSTSVVPVGGTDHHHHHGTRTVPLILYLYRLYDLNVHAHQLNFVQQFTSALSRIVRSAPKEDFIQDAVVQEQLRRQQQDSSASGTNNNNNNNGNTAATTSSLSAAAAQQQQQSGGGGGAEGPSFETSSTAALTASLAALSLPAMALHGLVRIVELLTTQAPPEEETGRDVLAALPAVPNREWKLKEQQQVDLFNASPKKAVYKMFSVSAEENAIPAEHSDFASQWDHTRIPPVPSAETAAKVEDVADFLTSVGSLDPEAVAEFLTTPAVFPLHVCMAYLRRLPLAGRSVLEAISELLMRVQLPKEGQRIERLLEYFSAAYFDANDVPGIDREVFPFKNDTAVFIVVVATVMLNTNIHNPSAGMRLDLKSFRGQLRRCNDNESFTDVFVDEIFYSISTHPLESIKSVTIDPTANADLASRGAFDMFFVSQEEKRQLAFGVERQRMVSETRQLLQLRTNQAPPRAGSSSDSPLAPPPPGVAVTVEWWCAATKDLFLSTWSAVCAVFGPAMYEGTSAPLPVLLQCVRGLQSLLCTAAAFDLSTECTVTLLTLLRMADSTPVRSHCRRAVLVVAATSYSVHFPVRCWVAVCQLMLELRLSATSAAPPLVEDVFTRMENLTRLSVEAEERRELAAHTQKSGVAEEDDHQQQRGEGEGAATAAAATTGVDKPTEAIHRVLEGIMTTISGYAVGDVGNMAAALVLLRRALEFTRIIHGRRATDVVYYVNIRDFSDVVVPAYVELIKKHSLSDDGLQVLFECLVEVLCTMWLSYSTCRIPAPPGSATTTTTTTTTPSAETLVTVDTAPAGFVRCFRCLRSIYDVTLTTASAADGAMTLLQMHVLQAVKEVLTRTAHAAEVTSEGQHLSLYTMVAAWQQALYPLGMALCDRRTTATEAGSLALLVLRKLVALSGGTGSTTTDRLPPPVRGALLWLLAQLAYMGGMCGDVDGAQVCVALLSSICTTTLAMSLSISSPAAWGTAGPASPLMRVSAAEADSFARVMAERDPLTQQVVASIEEDPQYVVRRTLARLGLLLRCEREQTRAEVVHQLRTLSLQMRPAQVQAVAVDLAEVVLEGAIGHAAHHYKTAITHTSLIPFLFFQMPVPASMRRCSRTSFRATLPAALGFLASELLSGLTGEALVETAELIMRRCLIPILLSPNSPYQSRFLAVRSLSQCITACLPQTAGEGPRPRLAQCVLDCVSLALHAVQVPCAAVVPPEVNFVGRRWLRAPATPEWSTYTKAAAQAIRLMDTAEPEWVVRGGTAAAAEEGERREASNTPAAAAAAAAASAKTGAEETRRSAASNSSSGSGSVLLADEPLIEYVNLLAQVLAGVPKELCNVVTSAESAATTENDAATACGAEPQWTLPRTSVLVLVQLTLQAAGTLFAILWRINHPHEVEQYALQSVELGREAPSLIRNGGLLPHAAVRSVLQCYLELAMLSEAYPTAEVLAVTTDVIEAVRQVQAAAQPSSTTPTPALPTIANKTTNAGGSVVPSTAAVSPLAADASSLQRLSPQEQQHVRTCNSGMYQQLSAVLGHLVKLLTGQPVTAASTSHTTMTIAAAGRRGSGQPRKDAFESMAMHPHFFSSLVSLLTPTAGPLIVTVRDYFAWYIARAELTASASVSVTSGPTATTTTTTATTAASAVHNTVAGTSSTAAAAVEEEKVGDAASTSGEAVESGRNGASNGHAAGHGHVAASTKAETPVKEVLQVAAATPEEYVDEEESLL